MNSWRLAAYPSQPPRCRVTAARGPATARGELREAVGLVEVGVGADPAGCCEVSGLGFGVDGSKRSERVPVV